ncbi:MAG TPA: efflux RND transporter periplasmic adaptor subunit [Saprospiraceae bacterium]|nr:efflux RND transporter periplasmic adaptor subunit [Saprospiraceae bacterium]
MAQLKFYLIIIVGMISLNLYSQEQHTHSQNEKGMENSHMTSGVFSVYAESKKYELTLKHDRIEPGKASDLKLYIADYITNKPINDVEIKITVQGDPSIIIETEPHDTGVYHLHGTFPKAQPYPLVINLNSKELGADLMLLSSVEVGKDVPQADDLVVEEAHHHPSGWWKYALVFIGGLGIGLFFFRRRPKVVTAILIVIALHTILQDVKAHGGHEEEDTAVAGNTVFIPKETQFLFDITTQRVGLGDFQPSIELFGTIIPAPGEFANITTPQSGKITALKVTPGQKVNAGQTLATIQLSTSLSEQVGVATETGRLRADIQNAKSELAAAERELNRLRSISDIAAKKDVQAAEARYNAAKANLQSLQSISSGSVVASSGSLTLKAPVSGTVGQFSLASGSEIISGTTLFSITSLDKVYIEAQVYDRDAGTVKNASKYIVTSTNDDRESDKVKMVSSALEVNPSNQSQKVLFELLNPAGDFKIGEFVTLQSFLPKSDKSIFVPNSAISEINGKPVIFVKDNPETYSVRYISLGEDNGTHSIVQKGIDEGERFVTEGTYQVKMMMLNQ